MSLSRKHLFLLTYSFFSPMLAWLLQLVSSFMLVAYACEPYMNLVHLISILTLALSMSAIWTSWKSWQHYRGVGKSGFCFLSMLCLLLAGVYTLAIIFQGAANIFMEACR